MKPRAVHVAVLAVGAFLLAPSVASAAIRIDDLAVQEGDSSHPVAVRVADDGPSNTTRCVIAHAAVVSGNKSVNAGIKGLAYPKKWALTGTRLDAQDFRVSFMRCDEFRQTLGIGDLEANQADLSTPAQSPRRR